ncbi:MAG: indole-3-glycerol-phosphate synthase [Methanofollis sp.]|uniref:indole-3-glycerol phosphate synthase TrpC n=1 Tax=Methanofollis sp. TaxID=2052835 RepID=UPI002615D9E8|nr:indole-3-glycerol-phosphate synthase [Methanofollis sp.]MDD4255888.1 indole-3-glycerol-phosphate synthase [Methanofollis sp.]
MILDDILARTRERVAGLEAAGHIPDCRASGRFSLTTAIRTSERRNAVIAEVKYASPSRGTLRGGDAPEVLAGDLIASGCVALSVLTEPFFFGGSVENLLRVGQVSPVPLLRKDFIIDELQIRETAALGADAVLLIAGVLGRDLGDFVDLSLELGLEPLVEVRTRDEAELALSTAADLIGINNRDLSTMTTNLNTTKKLSELVSGEGRLIVSESGVVWPCDVRALRPYCDAFLVGSALMSSAHPGKRLERLVCA